MTDHALPISWARRKRRDPPPPSFWVALFFLFVFSAFTIWDIYRVFHHKGHPLTLALFLAVDVAGIWLWWPLFLEEWNKWKDQ